MNAEGNVLLIVDNHLGISTKHLWVLHLVPRNGCVLRGGLVSRSGAVGATSDAVVVGKISHVLIHIANFGVVFIIILVVAFARVDVHEIRIIVVRRG